MLEIPVSLFLDKAASKSPAPGGGSVAALAGAMGAAMASMAANFTIGKKNREQFREETEEMLETSEKARRKLASLAELDIEAYEKVAAACKPPRDEAAIREALAAAMEPPLDTAVECARLMKVLPRLAEVCNKNLITDVGVAGYLLEAGLKSAVLNVEINLSAIGDGALSAEKRALMDSLLEESAALLADVKSKVEREVAGR